MDLDRLNISLPINTKLIVLVWVILLPCVGVKDVHSQAILEVGDRSLNCLEDSECFNRIHPEIQMVARVQPGTNIVFHTRSASDFDLDPNSPPDPRDGDSGVGTIHPLTGPVHIEGAEPGDVIKVTIVDILPGQWAFTLIAPIGLVSDEITGPLRVLWKLNRDFAVSDDLPGIRLPNRSFPGIVTVLPDSNQHKIILEREDALLKAGGNVQPPTHIKYASPHQICGEGGTNAGECVRTFPPREYGGNLDIRYLQVGASIYLPCMISGCGLAIGDVHYTQGDGEVSGTALEMDASVMVSTEIIKDGRRFERGPHYEGPSRLLDIPSQTFYATTGFPIKEHGQVPPHLKYLDVEKVATLENLSNDISLAARNALFEMIDYISDTYGYTREQAYIIASVAVDLRIGQLVDAPNVGVTAILPLDIFVPR